MKNLILSLVLILATSYGFGATTTTSNKSNFDVRVPVKNWIKKMNDGFRVGIAQGTLEANAKARNKNGLNTSQNESSNTKIQLHAGYEQINTKTLGYSVFGVYQDMAIDNNIHNGDLRNMRIQANATYGITKQAYSYGGLNYGKWYGSEEVEANIDAGFGFQAGIGINLHKRAALEIEYTSLINEGKIAGTNIDL